MGGLDNRTGRYKAVAKKRSAKKTSTTTPPIKEVELTIFGRISSFFDTIISPVGIFGLSHERLAQNLQPGLKFFSIPFFKSKGFQPTNGGKASEHSLGSLPAGVLPAEAG